jgi:hypothetical protein
MHLNILRRKTGKVERLSLDKCKSISKLKTVALSAIADAEHYTFMVVADNEDDINFIHSNFNNVPTPSSLDTKRAVWSGDMAAFIILNYPNK